jgi:hypothetical protein
MVIEQLFDFEILRVFKLTESFHETRKNISSLCSPSSGNSSRGFNVVTCVTQKRTRGNRRENSSMIGERIQAVRDSEQHSDFARCRIS